MIGSSEDEGENDFIIKIYFKAKNCYNIKLNFWMMEYYTILLNRNKESFLIFQTGLKISFLSPLTFYVTVTINPKSHALLAVDGHILFNML